MSAIEIFTLIAIVVGPAAAVGITLVYEAVRRSRENKLQIIKSFMATRITPADAQFNFSMNLIPIVFHSKRDVISKWSIYMDHLNVTPSAENRKIHDNESALKQTKLLTSMFKTVGIKIDETDIQKSQYVSGGLVDRDNLHIQSQRALIEIAVQSKISADAATKMAEFVALNEDSA